MSQYYGIDMQGPFKVQEYASLPSWTAAMERVLIDVSGHLYLGGSSDWVALADYGLPLGQVLYDCIVDAGGGGDYTTVTAALAAGMKTLFVRNGTYADALNIVSDDVVIIGESQEGVIITGGSPVKSAVVATKASTITMAKNSNIVVSGAPIFAASDVGKTIITNKEAVITAGRYYDETTQAMNIDVFSDTTHVVVDFRARKDLSWVGGTTQWCTHDFSGEIISGLVLKNMTFTDSIRLVGKQCHIENVTFSAGAATPAFEGDLFDSIIKNIHLANSGGVGMSGKYVRCSFKRIRRAEGGLGDSFIKDCYFFGCSITDIVIHNIDGSVVGSSDAMVKCILHASLLDHIVFADSCGAGHALILYLYGGSIVRGIVNKHTTIVDPTAEDKIRVAGNDFQISDIYSDSDLEFRMVFNGLASSIFLYGTARVFAMGFIGGLYLTNGKVGGLTVGDVSDFVVSNLRGA